MVEWKGFGKPKDTAEIELYDYVNDPLETKHIAKEDPETVSILRAILDTYPEGKPQIPVGK